jgi:stage V sporulation protein G
MNITKVTLRPVAMNKVVAIASIVVDDCFVIHDLRIVNGDKGLFVAMPSRKLPNGEFRDICHPINTDARTGIQEAVLAEFQAEGGIEAFSDVALHAAYDETREIGMEA